MIHTPDSEIQAVDDSYTTGVKRQKHEIYKLSWYMRGGVDSQNLMYNTDLEDLQILGKIVEENIETVKSSGLALL